jgi:predicted MFS family arabinose efflux permease
MTKEADMQQAPNMPKVIPSVWISLVVAAIGTATAFGAPISDAQSAALVGLVGALSAVIPALDVWLRRGRLKYLADTQKQPTTVINNHVPQEPSE